MAEAFLRPDALAAAAVGHGLSVLEAADCQSEIEVAALAVNL